jgi:hypothetical protein
MEQNQMSKFCINLESMMLPDAIAAVVEAWYDAQNAGNMAKQNHGPYRPGEPIEIRDSAAPGSAWKRGWVFYKSIQQHIRIACSTGATRLFRNNTGTLRDQHGRPVQFGLCKGSADLIGWKQVTVTPEMVGQQVAVFLSIEVKTPTGRIRPEQRAWMETVQSAGGIAGVARSVEDALRLTTAAHGV